MLGLFFYLNILQQFQIFFPRSIVLAALFWREKAANCWSMFFKIVNLFTDSEVEVIFIPNWKKNISINAPAIITKIIRNGKVDTPLFITLS